MVLVVQSTHQTTLYLASVEPTTSSTSHAAEGGGAIFSNDNTVISFYGINNLIYNSATFNGGGGGAICTYDSVVLSFSGTSNFINNSAGHTGGAIFSDNTVITSVEPATLSTTGLAVVML